MRMLWHNAKTFCVGLFIVFRDQVPTTVRPSPSAALYGILLTDGNAFREKWKLDKCIYLMYSMHIKYPKGNADAHYD